jgi:hypothetical protein
MNGGAGCPAPPPQFHRYLLIISFFPSLQSPAFIRQKYMPLAIMRPRWSRLSQATVQTPAGRFESKTVRTLLPDAWHSAVDYRWTMNLAVAPFRRAM